MFSKFSETARGLHKPLILHQGPRLVVHDQSGARVRARYFIRKSGACGGRRRELGYFGRISLLEFFTPTTQAPPHFTSWPPACWLAFNLRPPAHSLRGHPASATPTRHFSSRPAASHPVSPSPASRLPLCAARRRPCSTLPTGSCAVLLQPRPSPSASLSQLRHAHATNSPNCQLN